MIETQCHHLLNAPYSAFLRKTILQCLARDQTVRPTPRELAEAIERAASLFDPPLLALEEAGGVGHLEPTDDGSIGDIMGLPLEKEFEELRIGTFN